MLKRVIDAAVGALVTGLAVTAYFSVIAVPAARQDERRTVALEASQRALELIQKGNRDASELGEMSADDLCRELLGGGEVYDTVGVGGGGVCDDAADAGNGALHQPER